MTLARIVLVFGLVLTPLLPVLAQNTVIDENYPDPNTEGFTIVPTECLGESAATECGWEEFVLLVRNVIGFILYFSIAFAVLLFVYAGFLYLTNAGNPGRIGQAKKIFWAVTVGLIIIFSAYLIVSLIVSTLGTCESFNPFTDIDLEECDTQ